VQQPRSRERDGSYTWAGIVNILGPDQTARPNALIAARMKRDGYYLDHPALVPAFGVGIIRRIAPHSNDQPNPR
jgi:hypothetical protein